MKNVIWLKDEILKEVQGEERNGKFILLTLDTCVGKELFDFTQNSHKDDGIVLSRAAKIIPKHTFDKEEIFNRVLPRKKQKDSVPSPLLHLISLILNGGSILDDNSKSVGANIGQLIKFNTVKHKRQTSSAIRHSKKNKTHAKTRKKSLVEKLDLEGLSISYLRVQEIQDNTTKQLCQHYLDEEIVAQEI